MLDINNESQVRDFMRMARQKLVEPDAEEIRIKQEVSLLTTPKLLVRFYIGAIRAPEWTEQCPIYKDQVMVFIQAFGERDSLTAFADETHIEKYPREYELFQRNYERRVIPLTSMPKVNPSVVSAFDDLGVRSINDLLAKENLPAHLEPYREYAKRIKAIHDEAGGLKKRPGRPKKVA